MTTNTSPEPGSAAPDFTLPDVGGDNVSLADFRGKWVVLYFYPRDNTSGCTTEASEFSSLVDTFHELGAVVIGISKDSVASHQSFTQKHNLRVLLLADTERTTLEAYGAWRLKKAYGKESMGTVRSTVLIDPEGNVAAFWPRVAKAAGHAAKVLERLRELA